MSQNNHTGISGARRPVNETNIKKNKKANDKVLETLKKLADADK
ncbi:hypothetical protein ACFQ4L_10835 [Lapidilactobacillus mulanensis]|uniref:Uncharacterized protein n=1 Tax=Lapidilactobacillus mulanensis TaxID=2485999 RepID=A0ABW4DRV6_9LACO|nr:hypothetical protein [Lapidilactobacillus mulanensis]